MTSLYVESNQHPPSPGSQRHARWGSTLAGLSLCSSLVLFAGCDLSASGGASASAGTNAPEPPPKPEYARAFDEFSDVPHQIGVQIAWAAEPIDQAILLADELAALRTKLNIDASTFAGMCTVAFTDGTIEIGAEVELQEARAEIEATLAKVKQVGADLQGIPGRVKTASAGISKLVMSSPKLVLTATKELSGELAVAVGDGGVKIQADLDAVKALPEQVKNEAKEAKDLLAELPAKAQTATTNLLAAMKGEPYTPLATTGSGEPADPGANVAVAAADPAAPTTPAETTTTPAETTTTTTATATATTVAPPPAAVIRPPGATAPVEGAAAAPPAIIATRVRELEAIAANVSKRGDWLSAAQAFEEARNLAPNNLLLTFKLAEALSYAKSCVAAQAYFEHFVSQADPAQHPDKIQAAKKAIGELKTFDCPARTPEDEVALSKTQVEHAEMFALEGDWGGAAVQFYNAYTNAPTEQALAYEIAVASWRAHECEDSISYFTHFLKVADPRKHSKQIRESNKYLERAQSGECQPWAGAVRADQARDLYAQAQTRELSLDYLGAAGKYERAYALLPDNHALALRIAESYWGAQRCTEAEPHYRIFVANADPSRFADDLGKTQTILARVDAHGCPNALWTASGGGGSAAAATSTAATATATTGADATPAGGNETPPRSAPGGGGSVACSVDDSAPTGGWAVGLLLLAVAGVRRRTRG